MMKHGGAHGPLCGMRWWDSFGQQSGVRWSSKSFRQQPGLRSLCKCLTVITFLGSRCKCHISLAAQRCLWKCRVIMTSQWIMCQCHTGMASGGNSRLLYMYCWTCVNFFWGPCSRSRSFVVRWAHDIHWVARILRAACTTRATHIPRAPLIPQTAHISHTLMVLITVVMGVSHHKRQSHTKNNTEENLKCYASFLSPFPWLWSFSGLCIIIFACSSKWATRFSPSCWRHIVPLFDQLVVTDQYFLTYAKWDTSIILKIPMLNLKVSYTYKVCGAELNIQLLKFYRSACKLWDLQVFGPINMQGFILHNRAIQVDCRIFILHMAHVGTWHTPLDTSITHPLCSLFEFTTQVYM